MNQRISHEGIVTSIDNDSVQIKILSKSACASCNIKGACNMSEMKEKIISIPRPEDKNLSIGQEVNISMELSQANRAVIFAYLIPVIILVSMIFILNALKFDEGINALLSIGSLIPYYLIIFLFRDKLKRKFEYEIH
ncbi:MAG: SoxR reducing system RseC family protein [Bacteroidales bacterium]|nr:SoxR reducing system RseC family protein [Bacteroidales bacterium]